ncbi:MAG TPA: hypothetical protein VGO53_10070, partial [Steroidobacteraceae bacterium]|nr:hypothetical protein [Steroidobacteraceae bacterium]
TLEGKLMKYKIAFAAFAAFSLLGLAACEKEGPVERAGEKVDHAVDAVKNGGQETAGDKLEDAADNVKDAASDTKDAAKEATK